MSRIIVIGGSPGSGKSTLALGLRTALAAPWIQFGRLREFHLKPDWSNQNPTEESLAFDNLISILGNYMRYGYTNVLVDDLRHDRVRTMPTALAGRNVRILTLIVSDDDELRRRITARNDGWKDCEAAIRWNRAVISQHPVAGETVIDTTFRPIDSILSEALTLLAEH